MTNEEWRPIAETKGWYEVSNHGRVRRAVPGKNTTVGRILRPHIKRDGRASVTLRMCGVMLDREIAHMVAYAFIGPRPVGNVLNHKNGIKDDNRPENLEYCTQKQNIKHAIHNKLFGMAKLSVDDVRAIRASTELQRVIAERFGVSQNTISMIRTRGRWAHVP